LFIAKDFLVGLDDQLVVHADFAEFIFDHGDAAAVLFGEDAVEQRGLAGSEEASEDGDGNSGISGHLRKSGKAGERKSGKRLAGRRRTRKGIGKTQRASVTNRSRRRPWIFGFRISVFLLNSDSCLLPFRPDSAAHS
jgi:hypothetical protein